MLPYTIDDPITDPLTCGVEVTIDFGDRKRWLCFATPQLLASVGDWVPGTRIRLHLGSRHLIVVGELSPAIVDAVLRQLYADGELESRTLPLTATAPTPTAPNQRGQFVEFDGLLAVIVGTDADPWVPEDHVALWFGEPTTIRKSDGGPGGVRPEVWTVPADLCTPAAEPVIRH